MPKILTSSAVVMCSHGGKVQIMPSQTAVSAGGNPVLVTGDLDGKPISGCAQPTTNSTKPCTATVSMMVGASMKVQAGGKPVLLDTATGMTDSVPPGTFKVQSAGQTKVDANG